MYLQRPQRRQRNSFSSPVDDGKWEVLSQFGHSPRTEREKRKLTKKLEEADPENELQEIEGLASFETHLDYKQLNSNLLLSALSLLPFLLLLLLSSQYSLCFSTFYLLLFYWLRLVFLRVVRDITRTKRFSSHLF